MRALPQSVKNGLDAAELIARYFFEQAPARGGWSLRAEEERDCGGWEKRGVEVYVKDFSLMASKGLFSFFNTDLVHGSQERYYLVAIPEKPLNAREVPLISGDSCPGLSPLCDC